MVIVYEDCNEYNNPNYPCMSQEEKDDWFNEHMLILDYFEKKTKLDFTKKENYITHQMERFAQ